MTMSTVVSSRPDLSGGPGAVGAGRPCAMRERSRRRPAFFRRRARPLGSFGTAHTHQLELSLRGFAVPRHPQTTWRAKSFMALAPPTRDRSPPLRYSGTHRARPNRRRPPTPGWALSLLGHGFILPCLPLPSLLEPPAAGSGAGSTRPHSRAFGVHATTQGGHGIGASNASPARTPSLGGETLLENPREVLRGIPPPLSSK